MTRQDKIWSDLKPVIASTKFVRSMLCVGLY